MTQHGRSSAAENRRGFDFPHLRLCVPVSAGTADTGEIQIGANTNVRQYNIYWAMNPDFSQQSFLFTDPGEIGLYASMKFSWNVSGTEPRNAAILVKKVDGVGNGLPGAEFTVKRSDGQTVGTKTTDSNGEALFNSGITIGEEYTVTETKAPDGYTVDSSPRRVTAEANSTNNTVEVRVTNEGEGTFILKKTDVQNGALLSGAEFQIEATRSSFKTTVMTRADGKVVLTPAELPAGEYTITETKAPRGYELSRESRTVTWDASKNLTVTFSDKRQLGLTIMKRDADTNNLLENAVFNVYRDGQLITAVATNDYGVAHVDGLSEGYYEIEEIVAPEGYVLDGIRHGVHIDSYDPAMNDDPVLIVSNTKLPSLLLRKLDAETMKPLPDAVFAVYRDTELLGEYTTDRYGEIELNDIQPGVYEAKEVKAPDGYVTDSTPQSIKIEAGESGELIFLNGAKPGIRIIKIAEDSGKRLEGAVFEVSRVDGSYTQEFVSDSNGEIDLTNLEPGVYTIQEKTAPEGYVVTDAVRTFEIIKGQSAAFVFTNKEKPDLTIVKQDDKGNRLADAVVRITKMDDPSVQFEETTDAQGRIYLSDVPEGIYSVKEVIAPDGYLLNEEEFTVVLKAGMHGYLTIPDKQKPSLTIKKYDSLTGASMTGVTFEVYKDTALIGTYTTDANGEIHLYDLEPGTYTVKEIATDRSHIVNSTPQSIEITEDSGERALLVFLNDQKPYLRLVKLDADTMQPLPNAVFRFQKVGGSFDKEYTTGEDGEIRLDDLELGAYTVTETKAPEGYLIDDAERTVQVDGNEYGTFVFTDTRQPSMRLVKYDPIQNKYLPGASFRIAKIEDGSHYIDRITDTNGVIEVDGLEPGVYSVQELEAPGGYVRNDREYHVELFPGKQSEIVIVNAEKPSLKIVKTDAVTGEPLAEVGFLVKKVEGETENTVVTDENGEAVLEHLEPGIYEVTEKSVPEGYLLDPNTKLLTLAPNRTSVVRFKNYPKPSLLVTKVDAITKDVLKNAKFHITYASNNTSTGEINDLGDYTTDENGAVRLYNLKDGWYKVTEIQAPDGYKIDHAEQEIYIKAGENKTLTFEDTPLSALVIKKVDANTGAVLQGAKFRLRYFSGVSGTGGTVIGEYATSVNGTVVITRLKAGTYIVEETQAPKGYAISEAEKTVYMTGEDQDVITVEFADKPEGGLVVQKLDEETRQPLAGAEFKITTSSGAYVDNQGGAVSSNGIYVTDSSGQIHITGIEPGTTVVVTETKAPEGYLLETESQTVQINQGDTQTQG